MVGQSSMPVAMAATLQHLERVESSPRNATGCMLLKARYGGKTYDASSMKVRLSVIG